MLWHLVLLFLTNGKNNPCCKKERKEILLWKTAAFLICSKNTMSRAKREALWPMVKSKLGTLPAWICATVAPPAVCVLPLASTASPNAFSVSCTTFVVQDPSRSQKG